MSSEREDLMWAPYAQSLGFKIEPALPEQLRDGGGAQFDNLQFHLGREHVYRAETGWWVSRSFDSLKDALDYAKERHDAQ